MHSPSRLRSALAAFLWLCLTAGFVSGFAAPAQAQLNLRIGPGGAFQPMPIAIAEFSGDPSLGPTLSGIVTNNLKRSGYFTPVERARFPETPNFDAAPNFSAWKDIGVQGMVHLDPSSKWLQTISPFLEKKRLLEPR